MKKLTILLAFIAVPLLSQAQNEPPEWFKTHMQNMVGEWKTSNEKYMSDQEPINAFGMTWDYGIGEKSIVGSLYAFRDGEKTSNIWEFRAFYNPGDQKVYLYQFGAIGTVGMGVMKKGKVEQTFYHPDGTKHIVGHKSEESATEHKTWSFNIAEDGTWEEDRYYMWNKM